ncbi:MAG: hypothetical protein JWP48_1569 [Actinoallomurus sp.]|jgi:hypothetical protein|nr:hypothetical protein [Actinoallomurus sp.]
MGAFGSGVLAREAARARQSWAGSLDVPLTSRSGGEETGAYGEWFSRPDAAPFGLDVRVAKLHHRCPRGAAILATRGAASR